jgi:Histidine ammonia-lyase
METLRVSTKQLTYRDCEPFFEGPVRVSLTKEASTNIERSHNRLLSILEKKETIYGVNTGFGNLSHIAIEERDQKQLQVNLVRSHAAGSGEPLELGIVRTVNC